MPGNDFTPENTHPMPAEMSQESIQHILGLAKILKEKNGGVLDEAAIQAVSEATNAPMEYVRVAVLSIPDEEANLSFGQKLRKIYVSLDPFVRNIVVASYFAFGVGFLQSYMSRRYDASGLVSILQVLMIVAGIWIIGRAPERKQASIGGAVFGAGLVFSASLFTMIFNHFGIRVFGGPGPASFIFATAFGALLGALVHVFFQKNRRRLGLSDVASERQALLSQLVELQDKLKVSETQVCFVSVDIVGSTQMKANSDPLAVEFTFGEYHQYVRKIAEKYQGSVHSTAGDGVTLAFDSPALGFAAGRNIQAGLLEFNHFRNRLAQPVQVRVGIHYGTVMPQGEGVQTVNFAHVLDIAVHIQKEAPVGGIGISESAASFLGAGALSGNSEAIYVQGTKAFIWKPASNLNVPTSAIQPPAFIPE